MRVAYPAHSKRANTMYFLLPHPALLLEGESDETVLKPYDLINSRVGKFFL